MGTVPLFTTYLRYALLHYTTLLLLPPTPIATRKLSYDHYCSQLQEAVFSRSSKLPSACPLIPEPPTDLPEQERHSRTFIQLLFVTAPRQSQTLQQSLPSAPPAAAKLRS